MSATQMCVRAARLSDDDTNGRAYAVWEAAFKVRREAGDHRKVAILHAYRIELLYRALVVVMARRVT